MDFIVTRITRIITDFTDGDFDRTRMKRIRLMNADGFVN